MTTTTTTTMTKTTTMTMNTYDRKKRRSFRANTKHVHTNNNEIRTLVECSKKIDSIGVCKYLSEVVDLYMTAHTLC